MFHCDIIENICNFLSIYSYNNCDNYKLINKNFYNFIKKNLNILNNSCSNILMATHIKYWRPELDQTPHIYDAFIIFDNFKYIDEWINNDVDYDELNSNKTTHTIHKEVIELNLYNYYVNNSFKYLIEELHILQNYKLIFEYYFIYYFYEDLNVCYDIKFIILPYFDERLVQKDTFLHYQKIKKNTFYNHNIKNINSIEF